MKVSEYMMYKIWQTMDKDRSLTATEVMEALPCLAGVNLTRVQVQRVMAMIRKNWKTGQPQPQPPEPVLFKEMPLLATLKWSQKQVEKEYDVPVHQDVVDLVTKAFKGPVKERRELGLRLVSEAQSWLVEMMNEQNNAA